MSFLWKVVYIKCFPSIIEKNSILLKALFLRIENNGTETNETKLIQALFNYKIKQSNYISTIDSQMGQKLKDHSLQSPFPQMPYQIGSSSQTVLLSYPSQSQSHPLLPPLLSLSLNHSNLLPKSLQQGSQIASLVLSKD